MSANKDKVLQLKDQLKLLKNNINVYNITEEFLKELTLQVKDLEDNINKVNQNLLYLTRSMLVTKEGFEEIETNLSELLKELN